MKLRFIKNILVIAISAISFSCEDYLDAIPPSFTSPENFYTTPEEAETALTGVYSVLSTPRVQGAGNHSTFARQLLFILNGATDESVWNFRASNADYQQWGLAAFTTDEEFVDNVWFFFYSGINRANYLLEKLPVIEGFRGNRKVEIEAEARFLRGLYHMYLAMMHGAIPAYTDSDQSATKPRQPLNEVYDLILEDFRFAYNNLPHRPVIKGRATKWSAAGFLAKVYTYLGSARKTGVDDFGFKLNSFDWVDADAMYDSALVYTTAIISESGYMLIPEYRFLFYETTNSYQYKEFLMSAEFTNDASQIIKSVLLNAFIPQGNPRRYGGGSGWFRPYGELYRSYIDGDVRREHNITGNIRGNSTETIDGVKYYTPFPLPHEKVGFICVGKYRYMDPAAKPVAFWGSGINIPLLRYGDVLLLHAEALYFTGEEVQARNVLHELRTRAADGVNVTADDLDTAYYKDDFVEELMDERLRELCFENWRRIDLARFNMYSERLNAIDPSPSSGFYNRNITTVLQNWKPERIWIPIPLSQIDLNPSLVQNPGY